PLFGALVVSAWDKLEGVVGRRRRRGLGSPLSPDLRTRRAPHDACFVCLLVRALVSAATHAVRSMVTAAAATEGATYAGGATLQHHLPAGTSRGRRGAGAADDRCWWSGYGHG